jgi:hypothetical protein
MVEQEGPDTRNRTRELIRAYEYNNPDDAGLLDALDLAEESLSRLPESFSFAYRNAPWPDTDGKSLTFTVLHELWSWLGYVLYSTAYRARWLVNDVWEGLDEREFLRTCLAARALLELAASLNDAYKRLSPTLNLLRELASGQMGEAGSFAPLMDTHMILFEHVKATRFNWDAALSGDYEALVSPPDVERPATNILTLLARLPQDPKGIIVWHYNLLSEFVHPNMASQMLPSNESASLDEETIAFELSYHPSTSSAFDFTLNAVVYPLNVSLASLTGQLFDLSTSHSFAHVLSELFAPNASDFD